MDLAVLIRKRSGQDGRPVGPSAEILRLKVAHSDSVVAAVDQEREACAKIADDEQATMCGGGGIPDHDLAQHTNGPAKRIASAIRARGPEVAKGTSPTDAIEMAWAIMANVDWDRASPEWREAAGRWRDEYISCRPPLPKTQRSDPTVLAAQLEREACAKLVETLDLQPPDDFRSVAQKILVRVAAAIRGRGPVRAASQTEGRWGIWVAIEHWATGARTHDGGDEVWTAPTRDQAETMARTWAAEPGATYMTYEARPYPGGAA